MTEYEKVIYGNSVLISSYIEGQSDSGYVSFGLDYGTVADLRDMLYEGYLGVKRELVLDLNYFVLLDSLDTNPTYPWHRKVYEPYAYFQRDRLKPVLDEAVDKLLHRQPLSGLTQRGGLNKSVYYGILTDAELDEVMERHSSQFWWMGTEYYEKNLKALREVTDWCREHGVRLRAFWSAWNDYAEMPENPAKVMELADGILADGGVEVLDLTHSLERKYFHDLGHLNYEAGAVYFTEVIDQWLGS
jgi:hypothetical protein